MLLKDYYQLLYQSKPSKIYDLLGLLTNLHSMIVPLQTNIQNKKFSMVEAIQQWPKYCQCVFFSMYFLLGPYILASMFFVCIPALCYPPGLKKGMEIISGTSEVEIIKTIFFQCFFIYIFLFFFSFFSSFVCVLLLCYLSFETDYFGLTLIIVHFTYQFTKEITEDIFFLSYLTEIIPWLQAKGVQRTQKIPSIVGLT